MDITSKSSGSVLGEKLLAYILLFSSAITTITSLVILYSDYRTEFGKKEASLAQIELSYVPSLAQSLWNLDIPQIRLQLSGIHNLPYISFVKVEGVESDAEAFGREIDLEVEKGYEGHDFSLVHARGDERIDIGKLSVVIDKTSCTPPSMIVRS